MKSKVATVQMEVRPSKETNLKRALEFVDQAVEKDANLVCFPDYFLTDCPNKDQTKDDVRDMAESIPGPVTEKFSQKAKEHGIYILAGSIIEEGEDGKLYSTCPLLGPDGDLIGKVRKTHPENAPAKRELDLGITPAEGEYPVFDTEIGKIGVMLDMDGIAPEVPRILEIKGAEIIFWPVNFSARFTSGIHLDTKYYSGMMHGYVASSARVGWRKSIPLHGWAFFGEERADLMYGGGSEIDFSGTTLASVGDFSEGIAVAEVDPQRCHDVRRKSYSVMPLLRRPETYSTLMEKGEEAGPSE